MDHPRGVRRGNAHPGPGRLTEALELEGLLEQIEDRQAAQLADTAVDDEARPILLAVSDNGSQMTSGSTREFRAMCVIAHQSVDPELRPTRHESRPTVTSRASTRTCWRSPTQPRSVPNWPG